MRPTLRILACAVALLSCWSAFAQVAPKQFQPLYRELDVRLDAFRLRLPAVPNARTPIRAASLLSANCHRGEIILGDLQRDATVRELEALKLLGATGVVLEICYPLLTPRFRDPQPFLDYYANLANEVRKRDMKLLVQHTSVLPAYASIDARPYFRQLTKTRFERERFEELKTILLAVQPDYLTLVSEPRSQSAGLPLTLKDWRNYVRRSVATLTQQFGTFATRLGAGAGLWDDVAYIEAFAGVPGLSYVDLHVYPLAVGEQNVLERLLEWPDRIRAIDPSKRVVVSEAWLYKSSAADPFKGTLDPARVARNVYGFWAPLDQKFLRVLGVAAREKDIELVAPYWSRFFFAYLDYADPLSFRLGPRDLLNLAASRAHDAILHEQVTDTGLVFGEM